jgi:cell division protein FtsL
MILRVLNLVFICALIFAAAYVYRIKFDSTLQAERLAKIRTELRREQEAIAALRAQWSELENPARIEALAKKFLPLKPITPIQFNTLDQLPDHPPIFIKPDSADPIGDVIENFEEPTTVTGSIPAAAAPAPPPAADTNTAAPPAPVAESPSVPAVVRTKPAAPGATDADADDDDDDVAEVPAVKSGRLDR